MKKVVSLVLFVSLAMIGCVNQQSQKSTAVATVTGEEISSAESLKK